MQHIQEIYNSLTSIPASEWQSLLAWLAGSTLVASVLQVAKHKLNLAEAQKMVVFALGFLSFLAAFADFLLQNANTVNALPFLGQATSALMAGAVLVHRFVVSGAYYKVEQAINKFSNLLKEIEGEDQVKADLKAAASAASAIPGNALPEEASLAQFQV
jgi:uncharacterized membrane protein